MTIQKFSQKCHSCYWMLIPLWESITLRLFFGLLPRKPQYPIQTVLKRSQIFGMKISVMSCPLLSWKWNSRRTRGTGVDEKPSNLDLEQASFVNSWAVRRNSICMPLNSRHSSFLSLLHIWRLSGWAEGVPKKQMKETEVAWNLYVTKGRESKIKKICGCHMCIGMYTPFCNVRLPTFLYRNAGKYVG